MPGMGHSKQWWKVYHGLRKDGHSKESAAKIASYQENRSKRKKQK